MNGFGRAAAVAFALTLCAATLHADIITPTSVKATSQFGLGVIVSDSLINGAGLNGEGPIEDQLHDNIDAGMWFSGCEDNGIDGGIPEACATDIFAVGPVNQQIVEFEFESAYDVESAVVWQYNENNTGVGPLPGRGVKTMEILVSPNLTDGFTSVGTVELEIAEPAAKLGVFSEPAQVVSMEGNVASNLAQRVRFRILTSQSGAEADFVGLSEVRFDGAPLSNFRRGLCDGDDDVGLGDGIAMLDHIFAGGEVACAAACNFDGSNALDVTTAVNLFGFLFLGGPAPPEPFEGCGAGSVNDIEIGCASPPASCQ